ncbi:MAG: DUF935 family protein [Phycisphaerae bacterium]|nr:DUF935 family protein [Phycisphaerae bacterium]
MALWRRIGNFLGLADQPRSRQLLAEFDSVQRRARFFSAIIANVLENPDQILSRYAAGEGVELYRKMEASDPTISSAMTTRRAAVVNRGYAVADGEARSDVAAYVRELIATIENFREALEEALGALTTGFVPLEIFWTVRSGRWFISRLVARDPARYVFDVDGRLRLLTESEPVEGEPVPPLKYIVHRHRATADNPYGRSVLRPLYWPVTFSRAGWKWWATAIEKYGMPIVTASCPESGSPEDRSRFEEFVRSLQAYSWSVVPEGYLVELHEAKRASGDDYLPFLQYADTKKLQVILGQNLTAEVADRGSRAQAQVHNEVRHDITLADATALAETINRQLIAPAVELNFADPGPRPVFSIPTHPPYDLEKLARTYDVLARHVRIPERFIRQVFGIAE